MKKKKYEKTIYIIISIIMLFIPITKIISYIANHYYITKDIFVVNQVYVLWVVIPFLIISYIYANIKKYNEIDCYDIIIYFLILTGIISTFYAVNIETSIYGFYGRYEGLLSILSYYLLFLNAKTISNSKYTKNLIYIFMFLGSIQSIYAIFEVFTNFSFIIRSDKSYMAMGLCGNPNFLGSYMVMLCIISSCMYIKNNKIIYLLLSILFFTALCLANSTGPFLGFILAMIFFIIYNIKYNKLKRVGNLILIFTITYFLINYNIEKKYNNIIEPNYTITNDLKGIVKLKEKININNDNNDFVQSNTEIKRIDNGRVDIWINSLPLIKEYFVLGAGLDNYYFIFKKYPLDKAHNVYLQILITNGLLSLILYLLLCLIICIKNIKSKNYLIISLFIAFIGYSIQAFANISTIDVAPYFFIICGILARKSDCDIYIESLENEESSV